MRSLMRGRAWQDPVSRQINISVREMASTDQHRSPKLIRRNTPSGGSFCCVPGCTNSSSKDKIAGRHLTYYRFPLQDSKRTKLWLNHIRREAWFPKSHDRICSMHFEGGKRSNKPTDTSYVPTVFPTRQKAVKKRMTRTSERSSQQLSPPAKRVRRRILEAVTTSDSVTPLPETTSPRATDEDIVLQDAIIDPTDTHPDKAVTDILVKDDVVSVVSEASSDIESWKMDHDYLSTFNDPTPYAEDFVALQKEVLNLRRENDELKEKTMCIESYKDSDKDFKYMTNLCSYAQFKALSRYLYRRCGGNLKYWNGQQTMQYVHFACWSTSGKKPGRERKLSFDEEFFMVLVKLKRGLDNRDLQLRMRISESTISRIFSTWINFLNSELAFLFELPSVDLANVNTLPCFEDFPDVQVVLDCTELFTERSSDLQARKETFSNYKHHDTVKFLVGLSPNQSINFVSAAWGGRATDKHITLNSDNLLVSLPEGSSVMADRGFLVTDELRELGVKLIMPHFKGRDRPQFSAEESASSAQISSARVHIERAIQRIKTFHILERCIRMNQRDVIEQMFRVCAYLSNLQSPIVKC